MNTKNLTAACMILASSTLFASAVFAITEDPPPPPECLCEPPTDEKGNNGWGNGIDGTNPGTNKGNAAQVSTKQNTTPPVFDADKVSRFGGR